MQTAFCKVNGRMTGARSDIQGSTRCEEPVDIPLVLSSNGSTRSAEARLAAAYFSFQREASLTTKPESS